MSAFMWSIGTAVSAEYLLGEPTQGRRSTRRTGTSSSSMNRHRRRPSGGS